MQNDESTGGSGNDEPSGEAKETGGKKRRRRRNRAHGEGVAAPSASDAETEAEAASGVESCATLESSIAIDASIEIPAEEIVPKSINANIEVKERAITVGPMEDDDIGESRDDMVVRLTVEEDGLEQGADASQFADDEETLECNNDITSPKTEEEQSIILQGKEGEHVTMETHLSIDASIEVPSEDIVPESVGAAVEVKDAMNVEPI
ncbi:hypothetical protein ACHAWF_005796 [Thalassiosira exigua]